MDKGKVLIAAPVHTVLPEGLRGAGYTVVSGYDWSRGRLLAEAAEFTGIVTANRLPIDREVIQAAVALRWIGRTGSGMEIIDAESARQAGIALYNSPEGNCNAVGEHTVGLLLSVLHRISTASAEVAAGEWRREENRGHELRGQTVGIIGMGHTGRAFAGMLSGFGVKLLYYDKYEGGAAPAGAVRCKALRMIRDEATVLSFHVPLTRETMGYFNTGFLTGMKHPFLLLNTSRGEVVDIAALQSGLETGAITGFGGDVWPGEPIDKMSEISRRILNTITILPQVTMTPHIAGYTYEAYYRMAYTLLKKILER